MPCHNSVHQNNFSQENSDRANLNELQVTGASLLERIRFREQRFYWLYGATGAIFAFLFQYSEKTGTNDFIYYLGLTAVQCLVIGIGWNYYANDIKIDKYVAMRSRIYVALGAREVAIDTGGMRIYKDIYSVLEYFTLIIPSFIAFVLINLPGIIISKPSDSEMAAALLPVIRFFSSTLYLTSVVFFSFLAFYRHHIFKREKNRS